MVYRFAPDGSGEVIAEAARSGLEPFLGLHYPASDIPRQARILYQRNWLRIIADINAKPAVLKSTPTHSAALLDLSMSVLRSVSPIHIEYLQQHGRRRLDVGLDPARGQALGPVRLPSLFAAPYFFREAHGVRIVRPDVLLDTGGPRARRRRLLRDARPSDPGTADGARGDACTQHPRDPRFHRRLSQDDRLRRHRGVVRRRDHARRRDADGDRGQGPRSASSTAPRRAASAPAPRSPSSMRPANPSATAPRASSRFRSRGCRATA